MGSEIVLNKDVIYKRIKGEEIVAYGIFVISKDKENSKFFLLEEIEDPFYVNPRNTMFQLRYNPTLGSPKDYFSFIMALTDSIIESLQESLNKIKTEIVSLNQIKNILLEIKKQIENEKM